LLGTLLCVAGLAKLADIEALIRNDTIVFEVLGRSRTLLVILASLELSGGALLLLGRALRPLALACMVGFSSLPIAVFAGFVSIGGRACGCMGANATVVSATELTIRGAVLALGSLALFLLSARRVTDSAVHS